MSASQAQPATSTSESTAPSASLPLSQVPSNPLGEGRFIRTAAALIIGDEILNGKTLDRNSHYFAKYCFSHGIDLKRIEVIPDDQAEIVKASRRLVQRYDFVITTGGIGPTHDDITYASLATAFSQTLEHHGETIRRMDALSRNRDRKQTEEQRTAFLRMALFPKNAEVLFVDSTIWVPVVRVAGKLCIFPGIPSLFQRMLDGLTPYLPLPPAHERALRIQVFTEQPESMIAPYLTTLQERMREHGIQVGSYPVLGQGVFVSLIGRDVVRGIDDGDSARVWLAQIAREVEVALKGRVISDEEIGRIKNDGVDNTQRVSKS
ncbi:Molybdopterin binding protein [Fistulina hepatica ATCC 64428]|uniref:Molybdopterin binding protein n=1 Tax=Fistulina hepatica ATCC 64428 TaxID=1128425 RepID=A0A0D7AF42_9AGAR|nr:Molybdopterin binding protein [Fistulina hepatica ATCC 64428]